MFADSLSRDPKLLGGNRDDIGWMLPRMSEEETPDELATLVQSAHDNFTASVRPLFREGLQAIFVTSVNIVVCGGEWSEATKRRSVARQSALATPSPRWRLAAYIARSAAARSAA
ncbi:MAG: hypothetical protein KC609_16960, partial [Myxococcales bacterium]|nr:hypothetical protein [Myxococcales bacterium]